MTFFSEKNSIFTAKISDDFFLVIDQIFRILPFFSRILRIFSMLNVVYDLFLTRKTTISEKNSFMTPFSLFILSRASDNTTSEKYWGYECMGRPPPQIWGDRPPQVLRPWLGLGPLLDLQVF